MNKTTATITTALFVLITGSVLIGHSAIPFINKLNEHGGYVGRSITISGQNVTVVKSNMIGHSFTLSNGEEVHEAIVFGQFKNRK